MNSNKRLAWAKQELKAPLESGRYIVFDLETTGGNPERNGITEIFALKIDRGEIVGSFYSLVNPKIPIPGIVKKITGISNQMVRKAPTIKEVMPSFVDFIESYVLVSHNTIGDIKFLRHYSLKVCKEEIANFFVCTHLQSEKLYPEAPDKSLSGLGAHFGFANSDAHRAETDTYMTHRLFQRILHTHKQNNKIKTIEDAVRFQKDIDSGVRLGWRVSDDFLSKIPNKPGVIFLHDAEGKLIFYCSCYNMNKEARALRKFSTLPRRLLRVVLQTARITFEVKSNIFAAMLLEAKTQLDHPVTFQPHQWHLRTLTTLMFKKEDNGGLRLFIGNLTEDAYKVIGPIYDRKYFQKLLTKIAQVFGVEVSRKGAVFPVSREDIILSFLIGELKASMPHSIKSLFSWKLFSDRTWLRAKWDMRKEKKELQKIDKFPSLSSLMHLTGVVLAPHNKEQNLWELYPVVNSTPGEPVIVEGSWRNWLTKAKEGQDLVAKLKKAETKGEVLKIDEFPVVSALLWLSHSSKNANTGGCRFISLQDLESIGRAYER